MNEGQYQINDTEAERMCHPSLEPDDRKNYDVCSSIAMKRKNTFLLLLFLLSQLATLHYSFYRKAASSCSSDPSTRLTSVASRI